MPSLVLLFLLTVAAASPTSHSRAPETTVTTPRPIQPTAMAPIPVVVVGQISLPVPPDQMPPATAALVAKLKAQIFALNMRSETDAPFRVVFWASDKTELTPAEVVILAEVKGDGAVEIWAVEKFFANAARVEDWMNDEEKLDAARFQKLAETLETELIDPQVYLVGKRARTVVIIGKVRGGFGGVITFVVET